MDDHADPGDADGSGPRTARLGRLIPEGYQLGSYVVGKLIGEGGMSAVYAARDQALHRDVAVKVLHPNLVGDSGIRRRFLREGRITRGWAHPNVVPVLDTVTDGETIALVMERVDAPTLSDFLRRWRGGLPPRECGEVGVGILSGLEAAHARGVVHRDLKPGNVLVDAVHGRLWPRIIDFGIARVLEGTTYTLTGAVMGTCRYMSPEQVRGEPVDFQSDLYTFGILLYELVTGTPPFDDAQPYALMMAHTSREPEPPSVQRPGLHPGIQAVILECLAKRPEDRPRSAADVRRILTDALGVDLAVSEPRVGFNPNGHELLQVDGGTFMMGPDRRRVHVDPFGLDRQPVTNEQFATFLRATGYRPEDPHRFVSHWPSIGGPAASQRDHPVVFVSYADAQAYAGWLGLRLPTEAEWEKAARGVDGRRYPWGRAAPTDTRAWFGQRTGTSAVGLRPEGASPWGIEDLAGNVWEWCADADDPEFYLEGPSINPRRLPTDETSPMVVRGGGWMFDDGKALRTWTRASRTPTLRLDTLGFRCAG